MDESAQQAVQLGVNVAIFVIALSVSITLIMGVRDVAEKAFAYDASIPTGSRIMSVETINKKTVKGYELLSYYSNYMTNVNNLVPLNYEFVVESKTGHVITKGYRKNDGSIDPDNTASLIALKSGNYLNSEFEYIVEEYDASTGRLRIRFKEI